MKSNTTLVPGGCQARSEENKQSLSQMLLADNQMTEDDMARAQRFADHGHVLQALPTADQEIPIAVVSFVNDAESYRIVTTGEGSKHF